MAWKLRNGRPHLYLSRRDADRKTRSIYVGAGEGAQHEAKRLEARKAARSLQARDQAAFRRHVVELTAPVVQLSRELTLLTNAVFLAAGYRNHRRGEWRKKRVRRSA